MPRRSPSRCFVAQGPERPARALDRAEQIVRRGARQRREGLVPPGRERGPRLRRKENADYLFYSIVMFMRETLLR
jgi:hypothetical protein